MILNFIASKSLELTSAEKVYSSILEGNQSIKFAKKIISQKITKIIEKNPQAEIEILHAQLRLVDALNDLVAICRKYNL
jgi:hypothetical protein